MKIVKYEKQKNSNYKIYLDNNKNIILDENVIVKNNLLYKSEIDKSLYDKLSKEQNDQNIYNKCVKYICVRLRSIKEMKDYLKKNNIENNKIDNIINKLIDNKLLDDDKFSKAFIKDKLNFSNNGPYKIKLELKKLGVEDFLIEKNISDIDYDLLYKKVNKLIDKYINSHKKYEGIVLKNKIYNYMMNLGYSNSLINECLSEKEF